MSYAYYLTDLGLKAPKPIFCVVVIILIQIGYYIRAYFVHHIYIWAKNMKTSTGIFHAFSCVGAVGTYAEAEPAKYGHPELLSLPWQRKQLRVPIFGRFRFRIGAHRSHAGKCMKNTCWCFHVFCPNVYMMYKVCSDIITYLNKNNYNNTKDWFGRF